MVTMDMMDMTGMNGGWILGARKGPELGRFLVLADTDMLGYTHIPAHLACGQRSQRSYS